MKIAIIGGGASGMVAAYLLDQQGHHVTVFEKQPILGGHIRTLNQNVSPNHSDCDQVLENGVLEFPSAFHNFLALMKRLNVELEPVDIGSGLFFPNGHHILSGTMIRRNFTGLKRFLEYMRLDTLYARSAGFWVRMQFPKMQDFYDQSMSQHLGQDCERNVWLKLLTMYSYSTPYELIENFPAELAIPALRQYIFVKWYRIQGGVYSYIEKILEQFRGEIILNASVKNITRTSDGITLDLSESQQSFEKVIFATPPDQVMKLLVDPTPAETRRFERWQPNYARTFLHADTSMYKSYGIAQPSEFDFFKTDQGWGYNAFLNQLCDIKSGQCYSLAFNIASLIDKNKIIHIQEHHTPLYTTESFHYRDQIVKTNGENNTYHVGAYLGDGLHEGAVTSAMQVAKLIQ